MLEVLSNIYDSILLSLPENYRILPPLFVFSILIALYAIFVFVFYRFLAKRDILSLNLKKYNVFQHAGVVKTFAIIFYILQFAIVIPVVITIWFSGLSILLIMLVKEQTLAIILLISASIIGGIRLTSYFSEDLSRDLAKMFPFTLLGVAILTPGFFDTLPLSRLAEIPEFLGIILYYALFIAILEIVLRIFYIAYKAITSGGEELGLNADWVEVEEEKV